MSDGGQHVDRSEIPDDVELPDSKHSINKLLICHEKGYGEFDGPWAYSGDGWQWSVRCPLADDEYNSLSRGERSTLEHAEGKTAVAFADGSVEAYGHVKSVDEIEGELMMAVETPGRLQ